MNDNFIPDQIDPQIIDHVEKHAASAIANYRMVAATAGTSALFAMSAVSAFGAGSLPQQVTDILNYALTLEYFEATFYKNANAAKGLIPAKYQALFEEIGRHELGHVALLNAALGSSAVKAPKIDFTAGGKYPDVFSNFDTFKTLSATIEDLGVAAFKGQIPNLAGTPVLTTALQIHSIEARHAASVRVLVGKPGSDSGFDTPKSKDEILEAVKPFLS